uniref:Cellulose synthase n=1 Tax=Cucumis sativus TaxID=3659 RepID=A0A0A0LT70_CUCSA
MTAAPLFQRVAIKRTIDKLLDATIFLLLLSLLGYRLHFLATNPFNFLHFTAFLCESSFAFTSFLLLVIKSNPFHCITYPHRLLERNRVQEIPAVDVFVTTADASLEPVIITVNTVLSILAVDYPVDKLSCYVSDDGCSPITFYSLREAVKFAKIWAPFCKKYGIRVRAPFQYFADSSRADESKEFQHHWNIIKGEYETLCRKIEEAEEAWDSRDLPFFSGTDSKNHDPIIKIIWENKEYENVLPHLIYVSREKRLKHSHHYKAGALNVLARVSGLMTNAPYILNVDCDMFVNESTAILQGICPFIDPINDKEVAYVQFPQRFYDGLKDDLYGNQLIVDMEVRKFSLALLFIYYCY